MNIINCIKAGEDINELLKVDTLGYCTRITEVIILSAFLIVQLTHMAVFKSKWYSNVWAIVDPAVIVLLIVLRVIWWDSWTNGIFLLFQ